MIAQNSSGPKRPLTGRGVLIWIVAFFAVVMAVNAVFVYFAFKSWPGMTNSEPYRQGIAYNRTLAAARIQSERHWQSDVDYASRRFVVRLLDAAGAGVEGLKVSLQLVRGVGPENEVLFPLTEAAPGTYTSVGRPPAPGRWKATVVATGNGQELYRMEHSLMVEP